MDIDTLKSNLPALFEKYSGELIELSKKLRRKSFEMHKMGHIVAFGDFEGQLLYILIREEKPGLIYEISPAAGYSTNYIAYALTKNGRGKLKSFELQKNIYGLPTEDVIRGNLVEGIDHSVLQVVTGDVTKIKFEQFPSLLLLDSCHDKWFADWYLENLVKQMNGWILIQDIAFADRIEKTTEASRVFEWIKDCQIKALSVGTEEKGFQKRNIVFSQCAQCRPLESNAILIKSPFVKGDTIRFEKSPDDFIELCKDNLNSDINSAELYLIRAENMVGSSPRRANRHRLYIKIGRLYHEMGNPEMAEKSFYRALSLAYATHGVTRSKYLRELWKESKRQHWLLQFLCSRNSRSKVRTVNSTIWIPVLVLTLIDLLFNAKSWRTHA